MQNIVVLPSKRSPDGPLLLLSHPAPNLEARRLYVLASQEKVPHFPFWTFSKNRCEQNARGKKFPMGAPFSRGHARERGRSIWMGAREGTDFLYRRGSMFFSKREEIPAGLPQALRWTDVWTYLVCSVKGGRGAWPQ